MPRTHSTSRRAVVSRNARGCLPAPSRSTPCRRGALERDLQDAALGLERLATQGAWELDGAGRVRAAELAVRVRLLASSRSAGEAVDDDAQ